MLDSLKKKLGIVPNVEKEAVTDKLEVVLSVTETEEYKELLTGFTEQSNQLDAALSQIDSLQKELAAFAEAKAQAETTAKQVKMDARLASLSKDVGDVRAQAVLAATEGLEDAQFEAIASALKMSADAEAASEMFVEKGVTANAEPAAAGDRVETPEGKALKAKYNKTSK